MLRQKERRNKRNSKNTRQGSKSSNQYLMTTDVLTRKSGSAQHGSCKKLPQMTLYRLELMTDWNSSWPYHTTTMSVIHNGLFTLARKSKNLWFHLALRRVSESGSWPSWTESRAGVRLLAVLQRSHATAACRRA